MQSYAVVAVASNPWKSWAASVVAFASSSASWVSWDRWSAVKPDTVTWVFMMSFGLSEALVA